MYRTRKTRYSALTLLKKNRVVTYWNRLDHQDFSFLSSVGVDKLLRVFKNFPQYRAVVEATHPKNAPFAYLEAGQFKNSLVTTGLKKIPEGNKIQDLKFKKKNRSKKEKKTVSHRQLHTWTLASITSALVVGFPCPHPRGFSPSPQHDQPEHFRS